MPKEQIALPIPVEIFLSPLPSAKLHAHNGTTSTGQIVQTPICSNLQVYRIGNVSSKTRHRASDRIILLNPARTKIGKKVNASILARELVYWRVIECPTGNRTFRHMAIGVQRTGKSWVGRFSFASRPAIVGSGNTFVNLLPGTGTDIVD